METRIAASTDWEPLAHGFAEFAVTGESEPRFWFRLVDIQPASKICVGHGATAAGAMPFRTTFSSSSCWSNVVGQNAGVGEAWDRDKIFGAIDTKDRDLATHTH